MTRLDSIYWQRGLHRWLKKQLITEIYYARLWLVIIKRRIGQTLVSTLRMFIEYFVLFIGHLLS